MHPNETVKPTMFSHAVEKIMIQDWFDFLITIESSVLTINKKLMLSFYLQSFVLLNRKRQATEVQ